MYFIMLRNCLVALPHTIFLLFGRPIELFSRSTTRNHFLSEKNVWTKLIAIIITPFLPGMAQSQTIRFNVPSGFFVGRATNPCKLDAIQKINEIPNRNRHKWTYKWMIFPPCLSLFTKSCNSNSRHVALLFVRFYQIWFTQIFTNLLSNLLSRWFFIGFQTVSIRSFDE